MVLLMENKNQGASKKKIKVRSARGSTENSTVNVDEGHYVPVTLNDSQWNGIEFSAPKDENIEHSQCFTDIENEIKVIELDTEDSPPLLLLFPELKSEEINVQNMLRTEVSTTDLTKMLVGKKPNLALLKPCKKLNNRRSMLTSVKEESESEESLVIKKPKNHHTNRYRKSSVDGNDSDTESLN